jgi:hypothetical protein
MFLHISKLIKTSIAIFKVANEMFLPGMNSKMIKKIVPLSKYFIASNMSATK